MMRRLAFVLSLLALSACGLRPLYGGGSGGVVATTLDTVTVSPIAGQA